MNYWQLSVFIDKEGYVLPAGATVAISIHGMHRNPALFSDPDSFKPERFLREHQQGGEEIQYSCFMPFSAGPRNCIGKSLLFYKASLKDCDVFLMLRQIKYSLTDSCYLFITRSKLRHDWDENSAGPLPSEVPFFHHRGSKSTHDDKTRRNDRSPAEEWYQVNR